MIRMFHQPAQFAEALDLKARWGEAITPLAGGTDLLVALNRGQWQPQHILDMTRIGGNTSIKRDNGAYAIAGGATHSQLSTLPVTALAAAALSVGGPQIRNRGTIAGNLATASPAGDASTALLALDATVELAHADRGSRELPVRNFFLDYRRTALQRDELLARIRIPADWATTWHKIGKRNSVNISVVCCAIGRSPAGRYCVALGSVGPYPLRAGKTEELLNAYPLTAELIDEAAALVMTEVSPIDDHRASAAYRRAMCGTVIRRMLAETFLPARRR